MKISLFNEYQRQSDKKFAKISFQQLKVVLLFQLYILFALKSGGK